MSLWDSSLLCSRHPPLQTLDLGYLQTQTTANATPRKNSARAYPVTLAIFKTDNTSRKGRTRSRSEEIIRPMEDSRERNKEKNKRADFGQDEGKCGFRYSLEENFG